MLTRLTRFERRDEALASSSRFARRLGTNLAAALALILVSLLIGIAGYKLFEGMSLTDAYLNAAMILGGMGPVGTLNTTAGKLFAGTYALFCGVVLIFATGVILAPVVHRVLHEFHVEDEGDDVPSKQQQP